MLKTKLLRNKGFSLVELMVTIAIIAILASIAIPAYSNYTTRSRIAEQLGLMAKEKAIVADKISDLGLKTQAELSSADLGDIAVEPSQATSEDNTYILNRDGSGNTGSIVSIKDINGTIYQIALRPKISSGLISWDCEVFDQSNGSAPSQSSLPSNCTTSPDSQTNSNAPSIYSENPVERAIASIYYKIPGNASVRDGSSSIDIQSLADDPNLDFDPETLLAGIEGLNYQKIAYNPNGDIVLVIADDEDDSNGDAETATIQFREGDNGLTYNCIATNNDNACGGL